jgi:putative peptidoglycan lipid II flippase
VAGVRQIVPAFYALGDTRTPVVVSAIDLGAFVALALGLRGSLGHVAISVAVAGSSAAQLALLAILLQRRMGTLRASELGGSIARTLAASAIAGAGGWGAARLMAAYAAHRAWPGIAGGVTFAVLFVAAAWGFGSKELGVMAGAARRRLLRTAR